MEFASPVPRRGIKVVTLVAACLILAVSASAPAAIPENPERWVAHYDDGRSFPDYGERLVLSPDGWRAFVSGRTVLFYDQLGRPVYGPLTIAYDTRTGEREWVRDIGSRPAVSHDGTLLFVAGGSAVTALRAGDGSPLWTADFEDPTGEHAHLVITSIAAGPDGARVYVAGFTENGDYAIVAHAAWTGAREWITFPESSISFAFGASIATSPDGAQVFLAARGKDFSNATEGTVPNFVDYMVLAFDARTGEERWIAHHDGGSHDFVTALASSPDGSHVYVTGWSRASLEPEEDDRYAMETVAFEVVTGRTAWVARHGEQADVTSFPPSIAVSRDGQTVFVAGPVGLERTDSMAYGVIAYNAEKGGVVRWSTRFDANADADDVPNGIAASLDGEAVYVTGHSFGTLVLPKTTISVDARNGKLRWVTRHGGEHGRGAYGAAIAVSPGGATVYVTGAAYLYPADYDMLTIAYRATTCAEGQDEAGPVSGIIHETVEPHAGPARPLVHGVNCDVVVPAEQFSAQT